MLDRADLFDLCCTAPSGGWTLHVLAGETDASPHRIGPMLEDLRSLGLLDIDRVREPIAYRATPWATIRSAAIRGLLDKPLSGPWDEDARRRCRAQVERILRQKPGCILVYTNDGTRRTDLDFKGHRDLYGRAGWGEVTAMDVHQATDPELSEIRSILGALAARHGLRGPGGSYRNPRDGSETPIYEARDGLHLRFRPVDSESGVPLRDPESETGDAQVDTPRQALRRELQGLLDEALGAHWTVRATPGLTTMDLFPGAHTKALARDHLLSRKDLGARPGIAVFVDRWDGNDGPLLSTPLPTPGDRFLVLSVARNEVSLLAHAQQGFTAPDVLLGHLGPGAPRTEAFLHRTCTLVKKGRSHTEALARALMESQGTQAGGINTAAAKLLVQSGADDTPAVLAFDIDGTLNLRDGAPLYGRIPKLLWDLDSQGFQLAVITGKAMDRIRRGEMLKFPANTSSFTEGGAR